LKSISIRQLDYTENAELMFARIKSSSNAVWLDSSRPMSLQGRYDLMSCDPIKIIETYGNETFIEQNGKRSPPICEDPFSILEKSLNELGNIDHEYKDVIFTGGLMGFFGYDLGRRLIPIANISDQIIDFPDMRLGLYLWALVIDHKLKESKLIFHEDCPAQLKQRIEALYLDKVTSDIRKSDFKLRDNFKATTSEGDYLNMISFIKEYILDGDCYQTNISQHFSAEYEGDHYQAYLRLRNILPSPHAFYFTWEDKAVLSISPERFLKSFWSNEDDTIDIETKPIKGTVKRGKTIIEDQENLNLLASSDKDRAENLMIVDLLRNDLSKNCQKSSVKVPKLFDIESYSNVHHLVSTVTGKLIPDKSIIDLIKDAFPGGSITGAPKKRSMEIIEELEPIRRSLYCGSCGYLSSNKNTDLNIAIRTVLASDSSLHCWGGGGITNDSEPSDEYAESLAKITVLLNTLENR